MPQTEPQDLKIELSKADVDSVKRRFVAVNRARLNRAEECLHAKQRDFLTLLPFLFHTNHPSLPGFISDATPFGVSEYSPTKQCIKIAKGLDKKFDYKRRALRHYDIFSLFVMGSTGTVAYSDTSDFDIWICHDPAITAEQVQELRAKALAIEEWAKTLELEVHFFLIDVEKFRAGERDNLSSESSGTAQHHLLLEEFYRSGLLVAGRIPLWWLVPPEHEADYAEYGRYLCEHGLVNDYELIDFGALTHIPAEEFFGAALWQIYKGIDSPYKSVLKLLLIEAYAGEYPQMDLLSHRFKRAIYRGETQLDDLDPYVMMCNKVEDYLRGRNEEQRLELARRCFYFKVNEQLSRPDHSREKHWRRELMEQLTQAWGWDHTHLLTLDTRSTWKFHRVNDERKTLIDELTHSYKLLSQFARDNAGLALISQEDLTVLGRKLYAAFERKAGKIEIINHDISANLVETHLTILHTLTASGADNWLLYSGTVTPDKAHRLTPMKRTHSIIELIAWCHFNKLMSRRTNLALYAQDSELAQRELQQVIEVFSRELPVTRIDNLDTSDFANPARALKCALFINLGLDPMASRTRLGKHLLSDKNDALAYGGLSENLALTFEQTLMTSWNEILTSRFTGETALMDCVCNYLRWAPLGSARTLPPIEAYSFSSHRGTAIARRIEELFSDIVACYYGHASMEAARYILTVAHKYYVLQFSDGTPRHKKIETYPALLRYLSLPQASFSPVVMDRYALSNTLLPVIYKANREGVIQFFYRVVDATADVYILDEKGSLFHQNITFYSGGTLLDHFNVFLESVANRVVFLSSGDPGTAHALPHIEFYQVFRDEQRNLRLDRQLPHTQHARRGYFSLQVIGDVVENEQPVFTVYCNEREFSTAEHGEHLFFEVAKFVMQQRRAGERYPIYITDIDLSQALLGEESLSNIQTVHFLNFKKQIEEKLGAELDGL